MDVSTDIIRQDQVNRLLLEGKYKDDVTTNILDDVHTRHVTKYDVGRADFDNVFAQIKEMYADLDHVLVLVCGPESMGEMISLNCLEYSKVGGLKFDYANEAFEF